MTEPSPDTDEAALVGEALRALEPLGAPLAAYVGGSRAFGLGNALSDVDLTVVHDDAVANGAQRERSFARGEISLHCQVRGIGELAPLAELFASPTLPAESASLSAEAVLGSHRRVTELLRGRYVSTSPTVEALRATLVPATVDTLSAAAAAVLGALSVRDAAGAARSGDWLTATAAADIALEYALDTALFAAGDPYRSRKFLPRRLADAGLTTYLDDLARPGTLPFGERRARETLLAANGIQAATLLAAGDVWTRLPDGPGPRRSPWVSLVVTDAGHVLTGATDSSVGRPAAVLWLLADGRPVDALARRFADLHGLDVEQVRAFVETNVAALVATGAVEAG